MPIRMKPIYAPVEAEDGKRILVDRLWPRGVSKLEAQNKMNGQKFSRHPIKLRKWYRQDMVAHWDEFKVRYMKELEAHPAELNDLRQLAVRKQSRYSPQPKEAA